MSHMIGLIGRNITESPDVSVAAERAAFVDACSGLLQEYVGTVDFRTILDSLRSNKACLEEADRNNLRPLLRNLRTLLTEQQQSVRDSVLQFMKLLPLGVLPKVARETQFGKLPLTISASKHPLAAKLMQQLRSATSGKAETLRAFFNNKLFNSKLSLGQREHYYYDFLRVLSIDVSTPQGAKIAMKDSLKKQALFHDVGKHIRNLNTGLKELSSNIGKTNPEAFELLKQAILHVSAKLAPEEARVVTKMPSYAKPAPAPTNPASAPVKA